MQLYTPVLVRAAIAAAFAVLSVLMSAFTGPRRNTTPYRDLDASRTWRRAGNVTSVYSFRKTLASSYGRL